MKNSIWNSKPSKVLKPGFKSLIGAIFSFNHSMIQYFCKRIFYSALSNITFPLSELWIETVYLDTFSFCIRRFYIRKLLRANTSNNVWNNISICLHTFTYIYISRSYRLDKIIICCNSKTFQDFRLSRLWSSLPLNVALVKEENEFKRLPKVRIKLQPLGKKYFIKISCFISSIIKPFRTFRN